MKKVRCINYSIQFIFVALLFISCSETNNAPSPSSKSRTNRIDLILGDKVIDNDTTNIRVNNFKDLLSLTTADLTDSSALYDIIKYEPNLYLIKHKKHYQKARNFNALLLCSEEKVTNYRIVNDFEVKDLILIDSGIIILSDNRANGNEYWQQTNKVVVECLDSELSEVWSYTPRSASHQLEGSKLSKHEGNIVATINVLMECDMCLKYVDVEISNAGKPQNVQQTSNMNSPGELPLDYLQKTFL